MRPLLIVWLIFGLAHIALSGSSLRRAEPLDVVHPDDGTTEVDHFYHRQHENLRQGPTAQEHLAMDTAEAVYGPYSARGRKNKRGVNAEIQKVVQRAEAASARELRAAARASLSSSSQAPPTMGLSVLDFGAVGDGTTDDTAALQAAFTECGATYKTCLIPAGHYSVTSQININKYNGKIRIVGEGKYNTVIQAMPGNTSGFLPGQAILNITWTPPNYETTWVEISQLQITAGLDVSYGIWAPLITRSYFTNLYFLGGARSGLFLTGWINVVSQCSFDQSHYAGLTVGGNNMIITESSFEAQDGHGIFAPWSCQLTISNNVIEGNLGFGLYLNGVVGLSLYSNYFEKNCRSGPIPYNVTSRPAVFKTQDGVFYHSDLVADVVIGNGKKYPTRGVQANANTFAPDGRPGQNYIVTAIVLAGISGGTFENNAFGGLSFLGDTMFYMDAASSPMANILMRGNIWSQPTGELIGPGTTFPLGLQLVNSSNSLMGVPNSNYFPENWATWKIEEIGTMLPGTNAQSGKNLVGFLADIAIPLAPNYDPRSMPPTGTFQQADLLLRGGSSPFAHYGGGSPAITFSLKNGTKSQWSTPAGIIIRTPENVIYQYNASVDRSTPTWPSGWAHDLHSMNTASLCGVPLVASFKVRLWNSTAGKNQRISWFSFLVGDASKVVTPANTGGGTNFNGTIRWLQNQTIDSFATTATGPTRGVVSMTSVITMDCTYGYVEQNDFFPQLNYGALAFGFQINSEFAGPEFTPSATIWDFKVTPLGVPHEG